MQVGRRLIIYVQGYDPRGLAEYYRIFRREYRATCSLYGLSGDIGKPANDPTRHVTTWNASTGGGGWHVDTRYMFLRWEDIIRRDFARPFWWKIAAMYYALGIAILNGVVARIMRAHWRFGLFTLYPMVLMTFWIAMSVGSGLALDDIASNLGVSPWLSLAIGAGIGFAVFSSALWLTGSRTYLLYLCDDVASTYQYAHRRRPDWEARMETFAEYVVDAVRTSGADEVVIVGHSSGSFLAVDVVDRALNRDPALGRQGPAVRLLTIGANLPIVGFHKPAGWFRDKIARLGTSNQIDWIDFQSRHDIMNFWPFDPIADHGIDLGPERRNPHVVAVNFRDLWASDDFERRRWHFFRAHFQFLLANERLGAAYDYYLICCGPFDLLTRATEPTRVIAAMAPKMGTRAARNVELLKSGDVV